MNSIRFHFDSISDASNMLPTQFIILRLSFVAFEFQYYLNKPFNHLLVIQYRVNFVENYIIRQLLFQFWTFFIGIQNVNSNTYLYKIEIPFLYKKAWFPKCASHFIFYRKNLLPIVPKLNLFDLLGHNFFDYYKIFPMLVQS